MTDSSSSNDVKNIIINPLSNNVVLSSNRITNFDINNDSDHISQEVWSILTVELKRKILHEEIKISTPEGISDELWKELDENLKEEILKCIKNNQKIVNGRKTCLNSRYQSSVYRFFTNFDLSDFDYDSAINAMSLVSALILTVPFSVSSSFNTDFWQTLQDQIDICTTGEWNTEGTYEFYYEKVRLYLSGSLYASLYTLW